MFAAVDRFVADNNADDVAVSFGEIQGGCDFAFVSLRVLVDPGADRDLEAEFGGNRGNQLNAARRRVQADGLGHRREFLEVCADFFLVRNVVDVWVPSAFERGVGQARQHSVEIGCLLLIPQEAPDGRVDSSNAEEDSNDGAHQGKPYGAKRGRIANLSPRFVSVNGSLSMLRGLTTHTATWPFEGVAETE